MQFLDRVFGKESHAFVAISFRITLEYFNSATTFPFLLCCSLWMLMAIAEMKEKRRGCMTF